MHQVHHTYSAGTCLAANTGGKRGPHAPSPAHFPQAHHDTMAALPRLLLSLLLAASFCLLVFGSSPVTRRSVTRIIYLNNGLNMGDWGELELCEDGSYAEYIEAKFQDYTVLETDETALNALMLYCVNKDTNLPTGHITSTVGDKGEWQGMRTCPNGFITAVRARVLQEQGAFGDNVAVQNFQFECNRSSSILTAVDGQKESKIDLGEWSDWATCPEDSAICGLEVRYSAVNIYVDDAGIADAFFQCCTL